MAADFSTFFAQRFIILLSAPRRRFRRAPPRTPLGTFFGKKVPRPPKNFIPVIKAEGLLLLFCARFYASAKRNLCLIIRSTHQNETPPHSAQRYAEERKRSSIHPSLFRSRCKIRRILPRNACVPRPLKGKAKSARFHASAKRQEFAISFPLYLLRTA